MSRYAIEGRGSSAYCCADTHNIRQYYAIGCLIHVSMPIRFRHTPHIYYAITAPMTDIRHAIDITPLITPHDAHTTLVTYAAAAR